MHAIVGQQIATKAQETVWTRLETGPRPGDARHSSRRRDRTFAKTGAFLSQGELYAGCGGRRPMWGSGPGRPCAAWDDAALCAALCRLNGVGVWTAEMLMLFSLQRPDILSWGDLAIQRGLRMLYRHKEMPRERFERCRRRYSPYGSVASLYLWAIAAALCRN